MTKTAGALLAAAAVLLSAAAVYLFVSENGAGLPDGFVQGNGRIEAEQVEIAAARAGRVAKVLAAEGSLVAAGSILVEMNTDELAAAHDRATAEAALARQTRAEAEALVVQRQSEQRRAEHELDRATALLAGHNISETVFEERETAHQVAEAVLGAAKARVATAEAGIAAAEAEVRRIAAQIEDSTLTAPVPGRVLYRLAEPGEVVGAGGPILTLLSLENIYMEVFLPAREAGLLPIGAEARIVLDALPDYAIPATVTFVSPEAQFTPKQVETLSEREQLVFRVRVRIPQDLVAARIEHVKTGLRGIAVIRLDTAKEWPEALERRIPPELFE
ncbi:MULTISPECIES: HlyD family secretion protein [unclassified Leisingera]|uniref:HlyD family secretion protein n=1 Tax=unclassified Leisingera TaxID=2614906 RepID=UPI0002D6556E|nr:MULTISPECIES: HlyD family efflux transporter periplasmic adaptor subunit [unclassified Leisingera]KIC23652.1 secretion protein HlyD [Leisingera sp. ANG-S3]KIC52223.1 secretion protein HlyD [Leisingera sp. ANG-S]KID09781.1 secretion protein HlyD [Leisingera sp. ANG1]